MTKSQQFNIFNEIIKWSGALKNWEKCAIEKIIANKTSTKDLDEVYEFFLIENKLHLSTETPPEFNLENSQIPQQNKTTENFWLTKIKHIKNVNALKENQEISLGKELTVIFGTNSSGKSGYARILKNACFTRSNKTKILNNVLKNQKTIPEASLVILKNDEEINIDTQIDTKSPILRDNFAVFDNTCIRVYTDKQNTFKMDPYGFDIFPKLVEITKSNKQHLEEDIQKLYKSQPQLNFPDGESDFSSIFTSLASNIKPDDTATKKLKELGDSDKNYEEDIKTTNKTLDDLNKQDPIKMVSDLNLLTKDIAALREKINLLSNSCNNDKIKLLNSLKNDIKNLTEKEKTASLQSFKNEPIPRMDSKKWLDLIDSAIKFNEEITGDQSFPENFDDPLCVLCQQPLSDNAQIRLKKFWAFIKSDAQKEKSKKLLSLEQELSAIKNVHCDFYNADSAIKRDLKEKNTEIEGKITDHYLKTKKTREIILSTNDLDQIPAQSQPNAGILLTLDELSKNINDEITTLKEKNNSQEKTELNRKLATLKHQDYIKTNFEKITSLIDKIIWIEKAEKIKTQTRTTHITKEQKKITTKLTGLNFKEKFAAQLSEFNIKIPYDIKFSADEGETSKKLIIGDQNDTSEASEVLSEGEQNCIAIADFLTEIELAGNISGIIFDDPVTSLDNQRKETIAKRLVKEAKIRQVIIFTHDIVFAHYLAKSSEDNNINFAGRTVSRGSSDQIAGHTDKEIFPHPHYEGKLFEDSKMSLQEAKDLKGEEKKEKLELGCSYLRTAYEDFIQKEIFCRVINRWQEEIKTSYLKDLYFDEETINSVNERYSALCRYIPGHSHSPEYQESPISVSILFKEINKFEEIKNSFKKRKKEHLKDKKKKNFS